MSASVLGLCGCVADHGRGSSTRAVLAPEPGAARADVRKLDADDDRLLPPAGPGREALPVIEPIRKGSPNLPYTIGEDRYVPTRQDLPMRQTGIASWYGEPFHGRLTAIGETYDMHAMTAAHPTMPLPSYALVRHLDNGREVLVRVNDRGPFVQGRIIDLSFEAARRLGIDGIARVEVVRLTHDDIARGDWRNPAVRLASADLAPGP